MKFKNTLPFPALILCAIIFIPFTHKKKHTPYYLTVAFLDTVGPMANAYLAF